MIDWEDLGMTICMTIVILAIVGFFGFGFWTDYRIQKEHLEIERAKIQCQQCLEGKQ